MEPSINITKLRSVFSGNPSILFDDTSLYHRNYIGDVVRGGADKSSLGSADNLVWFITKHSLNLSDELRKILKEKSILHVPIYAFSQSEESVEYTLRNLCAVNFEDCVARNQKVFDYICEAPSPIQVENDKVKVTIELFDNLSMMQPFLGNEIGHGEDWSLGAFTEVGLVPPSTSSGLNNKGYSICGTMKIDGVLVAKHQHCSDDCKEKHASLVDYFETKLTSADFPLTIEMRDARLVGVRTLGERDLTGEIIAFMAPGVNSHILEVAFGTNENASNSTLNWSINSPINESALGMHVAIGDGVSCPHLDFVCSDKDVLGVFNE